MKSLLWKSEEGRYAFKETAETLGWPESLIILFNYNTSKVVVSLSDSSDSLLVMVSTTVALARSAAKGETATENGIDDIWECCSK